MEFPSSQSQDTPPGIVFQPKNIANETIKTTGLWFLGGAGVTLGLSRLAERFVPFWSRSTQNIMSALFGAYLGALSGFDKYKHSRIYNNKTDVLNKYSSLPDIQHDIYSRVGGMGFNYQPTSAEQGLSTFNMASWFAWIASDIFGYRRSSLDKTLTATTILSLGALNAAHISGVSNAEKSEQQKLVFAEKLALERAAKRIPAQQTKS